ncbi:MAG: hydrogenase nickel incorporation protein HypB [Deferribacteres bacterium]|nr:hydrogenase nickel incorporation protein HypB [Deferribacteres bacterium]
MCEACGCSVVRETRTIEINRRLLEANEEIAARNRRHFDEKGIFAVNLIGSPGSGKTSLLEKTIAARGDDLNIGVLEGDIETDLDAQRIRAKGVPAVQLTTGGACHLEAALIHEGLHMLERQPGGGAIDLLFIENVGNLVCPSLFDLGEHMRAVLISVPEGHDKAVKYPAAVRSSHALVVSKIDLAAYFDFDMEKIREDALSLNSSLRIFATSVTTGQGLEEWCEFLAGVRSRNEKRKSERAP